VNTLCESEVLVHKVSDTPEMAHVEEGIKIKPVNVGASVFAIEVQLSLKVTKT
jgi:cell division control protein 11